MKIVKFTTQMIQFQTGVVPGKAGRTNPVVAIRRKPYIAAEMPK